MCWNKEVSLNTFIFSCFVLGFIYYNNTNTQYKLNEFNNPWVYIALFSFSSMQLIEYFLWTSIENNDKKMKTLWSIVGFITLCAHPIIFLMLLPFNAVFYRNILLILYIITLFILLIYRQLTNPLIFNTTIGENKHLSWDWNWRIKNNNKYETTISGIIFYLLYIFITVGVFTYISPFYYPLIFSAVFYLLLVSKEPATVGSSWCWISNSIFIVLLFKLLFLMPMCK